MDISKDWNRRFTRRAVFVAALFALAAAGMSAGDAQALTLYSTDLNTNELVKIDSDNGQVTVLGPVGQDLGNDVDMTASGCVIYVLSLNYQVGAQILAFDAVSGALISSNAVTFNGNPVPNAESLAEVSGQLVIAFESVFTGYSHILGNLSPGGLITGAVDYFSFDSQADADGMCARPDGSLIWSDRRPFVHTDLRNVGWLPPSAPVTFFSYTPDRYVHDIVLAGPDLFALDDAGRILIRQDPTTGAILGEVPLTTNNVLAGLAYPACDPTQERLIFTESRYEDPTLKVMDLDGGGLQDFFLPGNEIPQADWGTAGLALDEAAGKIYWLHGSTPGLIRRANLDGSGQEVLVSFLKNPRGLALDTAGGKMYWSASPPQGWAGGLIQRANLSGSGVETVYLDPDYDPTQSKIGRPRVDAVNGWVYFASNHRILRVNLDGPPFTAFTVVTGVSTAVAVDLDVAGGRIWWLGADTIEDVVCRANLDNTGFTVVFDLSPDEVGSNALYDLVLDPAGSTYLLCEGLRNVVMRGDFGGNTCSTIYASPAEWSPTAMTLDANLSQPLLDCNDNGAPDGLDVRDGTSADCNGNAIPDECELDPCVPPDYLLDQSADLTQPGRALGGAPQNQRWIIFQPFDVPAGGWDIAQVRLHGVTYTYRPEGFTATILPDDGGDYPDESQPLAAGDAFFRFSPEWVTMDVAATLPEGRHWLRVTANDENAYMASVSTVSEGLPSMSRSGLGNDYFGLPPIALRLLGRDPTAVAPSGQMSVLDLRLASPHPPRGPTMLECVLSRGGVADLGIYDVRGRRVRALLHGTLAPGTHRAAWDGLDDDGAAVAAGLYLARLEAGGSMRALKILRLE